MEQVKYTDACREISGFGGSYEAGCRRMVVAGYHWLIAHPEKKPSFSPFGQALNKDAEDLKKVMESAEPTSSGAALLTCMSHVLYAFKVGWPRYIKKLEQLKRKRCNAPTARRH